MPPKGLEWRYADCSREFQPTFIASLLDTDVIYLFASKNKPGNWCVDVLRGGGVEYLPMTYTEDEAKAWAVAQWRMG